MKIIPLTNFPKGLLDLVGSNNFGENPREMSDLITPVMEIGRLYLAQFLTTVAGIGVGAPTAGFNLIANLVVPTGKVWALYSVAAAFTTEAGVAGDVLVSLVSIGNVRTFLSNSVATAASQTKMSTTQFSDPVMLPAGTKLGVYLQNITGVPTGASSVECNALIAEFRG